MSVFIPQKRRWGGRALRMAGVLFITGLMLTGCPKEEAGEQGPQGPRTTNVEVATVRTDTLRETVEGIGTLRALEEVELRPELGGIIRTITFEEGSSVEQGQRLFEIDDAKLQKQLNARLSALDLAKAQRNLARKTHERVAVLRERGSATPEEFDQSYARLQEAQAEVNRLEAEVELIREQLEDTTISAPFSGKIGERMVDVGDFVNVGQTLAQLYRVDELEIAFTLPERFLGRVEPGQPVDAMVAAYPDEAFEGQVTYVSPSVSERTRDFRVKSRIDNSAGRLRPGAFGRASITLSVREEKPVLPEEALVSTRTGYIVYVVEEGKARRREVRIGLREPGRAEIRHGVEPGEKVVRKGHLQLSDGALVEPVETVTEQQPPEAGATSPAPQAVEE